jgi:hypothetical protein
MSQPAQVAKEFSALYGAAAAVGPLEQQPRISTGLLRDAVEPGTFDLRQAGGHEPLEHVGSLGVPVRVG